MCNEILEDQGGVRGMYKRGSLLKRHWLARRSGVVLCQCFAINLRRMHLAYGMACFCTSIATLTEVVSYFVEEYIRKVVCFVYTH